MSTEFLFLGGAGLLALITIFLGISNWSYLSSLSAHITKLEDEIEKKSSEFETLKKERQSQAAAAKQNEFTESPIPSEAQYTHDESPKIEIVRNVRGGGFENFDVQSSHQPAHESATPNIFSQPSNNQSQQGDVLDVVDESSNTTKGADIIELALYSNAKKDTDFSAAWKRLAEILQNNAAPHIALNFANVMFLYDRELQYLEKFKDVILQSGGRMSFINCDAELSAALKNKPGLSQFVVTG